MAYEEMAGAGVEKDNTQIRLNKINTELEELFGQDQSEFVQNRIKELKAQAAALESGVDENLSIAA